MFELMHQPVQTRQTPYGDHPQRNGNSDHNRTAEDIGYLHLAVVGKGEREVWIENRLVVSAPAAAAISGAKSLSQRGTSLLLESVCEKISAAATGVPKSAPMVPPMPESSSPGPRRGVKRVSRDTPPDRC